MKLSLIEKFGIIVGILAFSILLSVWFASDIKLAGANPSTWSRKQSASATSSPVYLVRGGALSTTTNAVDTGNGSNNAINQANLAIQFTASSSTVVLGWRYEYAMPPISGENCVSNEGACDWYSDEFNNRVASSTIIDFNVPFTQKWLYGSSTDLCGDTSKTAANSGDRRCKLFEVPVAARYVRAVFYLDPQSSAQNGAVWSEWITAREN